MGSFSLPNLNLSCLTFSTALQADQLQNARIVVRIDDWPVDSRYPTGHWVRRIGPVGDFETELQVFYLASSLTCSEADKCLWQALLVENAITVAPFAPSIMKSLPPRPTRENPFIPSPQELA
jgi:exosome complex exonuclease DIS3/RRP44